MPPRFLPRLEGRARSSRSALLLVFSCSSSVSSESSEPLSRPAPAPLLFEIDARVSWRVGEGGGEGDGELRDPSELGIADDDKSEGDDVEGMRLQLTGV